MPLRNPLMERNPARKENFGTTCLFCVRFVSRVYWENAERHKLLLNLCEKMELDQNKIPPEAECDGKKFPFCDTCFNLLEKLWELKVVNDAESQAKLATVLEAIQKQVEEGERRLTGETSHEIAKYRAESSTIAENERFKVMKLRAMILSVREQSLILQQGPANAINQRRSRAAIRSERQPRSSPATAYNSRDQPGPSRGTDVVGQVLQEDESRAAHALQARPKRALFLNGVEILQITDPFNAEFMKCGVCNHTVRVLPTLKYVKGDFSPKSIMKSHISEAHKQKPGRRTYDCSLCSEIFFSNKELQEHKQVHFSRYESVCEICGRTINTSRNHPAFLHHKFAHKNDEERGASYDADENGSYNSFRDPSNRRRRVRGSRSPFAKAGRSYAS